MTLGALNNAGGEFVDNLTVSASLITLTNATVTTEASQTYNDPTEIAVDITMTSNTADITFNDTLDSEPLATMIGSGSSKLTSFVDQLPSDGRVSYNKEPHRSLIDFILASPAMAERYRQGSYRIVSGSVSTSGSDHNPVVAIFDLK